MQRCTLKCTQPLKARQRRVSLSQNPRFVEDCAHHYDSFVIGTDSASNWIMTKRAKHLASLTHEELMARYVAGDPQAFDALYQAVSPIVFSQLLRMTGDRALAEDLLQISFLKLYRARDSYSLGAPLLPWIHVIAKRTLLDARRPLSARLEKLSEDGCLDERDAADPSRDGWEREAVREALAKIPAHYRAAIELTKLQGFSGREAAQSLNTTVAAIKQRVHRGYELLRRTLELPAGAGAPSAGAA